jgi:hypothetical protein
LLLLDWLPGEWSFFALFSVEVVVTTGLGSKTFSLLFRNMARQDVEDLAAEFEVWEANLPLPDELLQVAKHAKNFGMLLVSKEDDLSKLYEVCGVTYCPIDEMKAGKFVRVVVKRSSSHARYPGDPQHLIINAHSSLMSEAKSSSTAP